MLFNPLPVCGVITCITFGLLAWHLYKANPFYHTWVPCCCPLRTCIWLELALGGYWQPFMISSTTSMAWEQRPQVVEEAHVAAHRAWMEIEIHPFNAQVSFHMGMLSFAMSIENDHTKTTVDHKLHQMKSSWALKLQDFCIVFLDNDDVPIHNVAKRSHNSQQIGILHICKCIHYIIIFDFTIQPPLCWICCLPKIIVTMSSLSFIILPSYKISFAKVVGATSTPVPCHRSKPLNSHPFINHDAEDRTEAYRETLE